LLNSDIVVIFEFLAQIHLLKRDKCINVIITTLGHLINQIVFHIMNKWK
jgi:hypothetical protein